MAYVTIPKDLSRVQSKVLFGLTKRQVICFGAAAIIGVPLFFLTKEALGTTTAARQRVSSRTCKAGMKGCSI